VDDLAVVGGALREELVPEVPLGLRVGRPRRGAPLDAHLEAPALGGRDAEARYPEARRRYRGVLHADVEQAVRREGRVRRRDADRSDADREIRPGQRHRAGQEAGVPLSAGAAPRRSSTVRASKPTRRRCPTLAVRQHGQPRWPDAAGGLLALGSRRCGLGVSVSVSEGGARRWGGAPCEVAGGVPAPCEAPGRAGPGATSCGRSSPRPCCRPSGPSPRPCCRPSGPSLRPCSPTSPPCARSCRPPSPRPCCRP
jgi:hypothetical protein